MPLLLLALNDTTAEPPGGAATILVVDDEPDIRFLVRMLLEGKGHRVLEANDGVEALAMMQNQHVSLIVTDYMMPRMNGEELVAQLRGRGRDVPVILITAGPNVQLSVDAIIRKPFNAADLVGQVEKLLRRK
jgi:CheY-like chemotaxis protein